jgi:hypothetical protein
MAPFCIRAGSSAKHDGELILRMTDSQLAYLADIGSAEQWGTSSLSKDELQQTKYRATVRRSEETHDEGLSPSWTRVFIAETSDSSDLMLVAAMVLETEATQYAAEALSKLGSPEPFIYLTYLVTDRNQAGAGRGAGAALIRHARTEAERVGVLRICLDCWRGNDRKLVRYAASSS